MRKMILACLAMVSLGQSSLAQELGPTAPSHHTHHLRPALHEEGISFDAAVARLTVKATEASAPATRQDLMAAMLLMSLRQERGI